MITMVKIRDISQFEKYLEAMVESAVRSGYNAKEIGMPEEQAVKDALEMVRQGKLVSQHKGPKN